MLSNPVILVCTDFGPPSDTAMRSAENIRRRVGGKVHAVHISDFPVYQKWLAIDSAYPIFTGDVEASHLKSLEKILQDQIQRCELECTSEVILNQVYVGIHSQIDRLNPDLVIVGHKGRSLGPFQLGGMAWKIIASSTKPVLVIKKVLGMHPSKVAGLVSTSEPMGEIISATEEFSYLLNAEPLLVSILKNISLEYYNLTNLLKTNSQANYETEEKNLILGTMKDRINAALDPRSKLKVKVDLTDENHIAAHLTKILEEDQVDLAIMKRHQKDMLEKILIGSETRRMLELFKGNILVLPPKTSNGNGQIHKNN